MGKGHERDSPTPSSQKAWLQFLSLPLWRPKHFKNVMFFLSGRMNSFLGLVSALSMEGREEARGLQLGGDAGWHSVAQHGARSFHFSTG